MNAVSICIARPPPKDVLSFSVSMHCTATQLFFALMRLKDRKIQGHPTNTHKQRKKACSRAIEESFQSLLLLF